MQNYSVKFKRKFGLDGLGSFDSFDKTPFGYFDLAQYKRLRTGRTGSLRINNTDSFDYAQDK